MSNISQKKRAAMLAYLAELKQVHNDDESIRALNEIEAALTEKKYGLVWEEHTEMVSEMLEENIPVFTEDKERKILANNSDYFNFLLEGDNLHALKLLEKTHRGSIDVIYIDPPYNTGAKNWKYNNDYVDSKDGFKHSKFISFLNERLIVAKSLLKDTGILVLTIDDYEVENMIMLLNEIFGEDHHLGTVVIKNNPQGRSSVTGFQISHEYALFYGMPGSTIGRLPRTSEQLGRYNEKDEFGPFEWRNFRAQYSTESPKMAYPIYVMKDGSDFRIPNMYWDNDRREFIVDDKLGEDEFESLPYDNDGRLRNWKWSVERVVEAKATDMGVRKDSQGKYTVYYKGRLKDPDILPYTIWDNPKYSASTFGSDLLSSIIGRGHFNYPKSLYAVVDCLEVASGNRKDVVILDFFAGSGTTGHAVMEMNREDKGSRKFILCTNNENNISQDVTYPRLKKIIEGYPATRKISEELYSVKLTVTNLKKIDQHFQQIESIKKRRRSDFSTFKQESKDGYLKLFGVIETDTIIEGLPHNLKYYKTDFIPKLSREEDILSDRLLSHIKEMVELENMCEIDGVNRFIFLREDELIDWYEQGVVEGVIIYIPSYILLSREIENELEAKQVKVIHIPDYYFLNELREANEL